MIMYILWGDLLSLNKNVKFWRFSLFSIFWTFSFDAKMANFKAQNCRLVPRFHSRVLCYVKERYLFFKICFQNYGQLKRKFLRPKNTSSTFLKQWFDVISFHKPRRVYPTIWYNLKPFANRKGRFKLSIPAKWQITNWKSLKIQSFLRPGNQILAYKTMLWVFVVLRLAWCCHILEMWSIHTGQQINNSVLNKSVLNPGARKWWAKERTGRERDTRISSRARSLSRPTSKRLLHNYMSRCTHALICKLQMEIT